MAPYAPLALALVVLETGEFPDTDAARRFVLSARFASFLSLAEYGLSQYRDGGEEGPQTELVRHAAVQLLLDLKALQRAAESAVARGLEPRPFVPDEADAVVWTRAVLAELAMKLGDEDATSYLLGLFERIRTRAGVLRGAPPAISSPPAIPAQSR